MRKLFILFLMILIVLGTGGCVLEDRDSALRTRIRQSEGDLRPLIDEFSKDVKGTDYFAIQESARRLSDQAQSDDIQITGLQVNTAWQPTKSNYLAGLAQIEQIGNTLKYCAGICGGDYENGARQKAMDELTSGSDYMNRALDSLPQQEPSVIDKIFRPIA